MDGTNVFCVIIFASIIYIHGQEAKGQLIQQLLADYEKSGGKLVTPDSNGPVNVSHSIALKRILGLENQVLTIDAFVSMRWNDDRLTWDPTEANVTTIRLPNQYIWQPDIMLYDNADEYNGMHSEAINTVITYDGAVFYVSPVKIRSFCKVQMSLLKRKHKVKCSMKFGSWTHDGFSLDLFNENNVFDLSSYDKTFNQKWRVTSATVKKNIIYYPCCPEPYIDLLYTLTLKYTGRKTTL